MGLLLKANLNFDGLYLAKIEIYTVIISKPSSVITVSNWYFRPIVSLNLKKQSGDKNSRKAAFY